MCKVKRTNAQNFIKKLKKKCLCIFSSSSIKNLLLNKNFIKINIDEITKSVSNIENFIRHNNNFEEIVAIGGGSAIDIGKYISYKTEKKLSVILTMISTNAFSTNKVCLIKEDKKVTLQAKCPDVVVFDKELLKKAKDFNNLGLCDVLSIHTALYDWKLASTYKGEKITKYYKKAKILLEKIKKHILKNFYNLNDVLWKSFKYIKESGIITNKHGSGRPESGSEHIYAKEIEHRVDKVVHGLAVINGIKIMSDWQENYDEDIEKIYKKFEIHLCNKKFNITTEVLNEINETIMPRHDRFTIIDIVRKENDNDNNK